MTILLTVFYVLVLAVTLYIIIKKRNVVEDEVAIIKETSLTWVIGIFAILETAVVLFVLWAYPERLVDSTNSWINTSIFVVLGALLGSFCLLFGLVKKTVATSKELIIVDAFGNVKSINWNDVRDIEKKGKTKLLFHTKSSISTVQGPYRKYVTFVKEIEPYLSKKVLAKVLSQNN